MIETCYICDKRAPHTHHVSYYPEKTVELCVSCHLKVHRRDGYHDELCPDRGRPTNYRGKGEYEYDNVEKTCRLNGSICETVPKSAGVRQCIHCNRWFRREKKPSGYKQIREWNPERKLQRVNQ